MVPWFGHELWVMKNRCFAVLMADRSYDYNTLAPVSTIHLYINMQEHAEKLVEEIRPLTLVKAAAAADHLSKALSSMVYSSNAIDGVGCNLDITTGLCCLEFADVDWEQSDAQFCYFDYYIIEIGLMKRRQQLSPTQRAVKKKYRQVIQHAAAAKYIIRKLYVMGADLSEDIIRETHRILMCGFTSSAGQYRQRPAYDNVREYMHHDNVARAMRMMIESLHAKLARAAESRIIDPVALAAKYCYIFLHIQPFACGNGRVGRLILNALLFKYSGMLAPIGKDEDDRDEYLKIMAGGYMEGESYEDMEYLEEMSQLPKCYGQLAAYTLNLARDSMREILYAVQGEDDDE